MKEDTPKSTTVNAFGSVSIPIGLKSDFCSSGFGFRAVTADSDDDSDDKSVQVLQSSSSGSRHPSRHDETMQYSTGHRVLVARDQPDTQSLQQTINKLKDAAEKKEEEYKHQLESLKDQVSKLMREKTADDLTMQNLKS